ncbi:hypothetical protein CEXT_622721 [Caerostris extrusa]|uniref:Uncharacterized protein n=1 Tax=Caerostris extrusa TaxID=172846 RepID=A0AAV4N2X3_CAEEX|nr:hypothetical protein CEXT_622721 [Caerostris extrusa]
MSRLEDECENFPRLTQSDIKMPFDRHTCFYFSNGHGGKGEEEKNSKKQLKEKKKSRGPVSLDRIPANTKYGSNGRKGNALVVGATPRNLERDVTTFPFGTVAIPRFWVEFRAGKKKEGNWVKSFSLISGLPPQQQQCGKSFAGAFFLDRSKTTQFDTRPPLHFPPESFAF